MTFIMMLKSKKAASQQVHFFAFSPILTSRRMASEREGRSACALAHLSTAVATSGDNRTAETG